MSHWKYKTLEEIWNLVLTSPEGKKGGLYPFKNLKIEQLRGVLWARDEDEGGTKQQLQEKLIELLGGITRVSALLFGEGLNQTQCEALVFEQLLTCITTPTSHHRRGHTCDIEGDILHCSQKRQALLHWLFSCTYAGHHSFSWKSRQQCHGFTDNTCKTMGIFYAKEDTRCPKQILQLVNLAFKHSLAMRTILTPPKTMTICKLYGIYYHSALHHASVIYRLVCLLSINAGLFERFFDRIVDITRRMWSKHTEDLVLNAFLYILEEDITAEENTVHSKMGNYKVDKEVTW